MDIEKLRSRIEETFKPKRALHILGCESQAAHYAELNGENEYDARTAALLHDITKEKNTEEQLKLCEKYGIIINCIEIREPSLLHALTGAKVAAEEYGVDMRVQSAIRYHTTGRENMSRLEKIIWLADYTEPGRSFEGVEVIRKLAEKNLDEALLTSLNMSIVHLVKKNHLIHEDTLRARNWLMMENSI